MSEKTPDAVFAQGPLPDQGQTYLIVTAVDATGTIFGADVIIPDAEWVTMELNQAVNRYVLPAMGQVLSKMKARGDK